MRVLILNDAEKKVAHEVVLFAARPENHYRPDPSGEPARVPGDDPRHVVHFGLLRDFRCVFSFTEVDGEVFRHLSISVHSTEMQFRRSEKRLPQPAMVVEIAHLFGFDGSLADWAVTIHDQPHCIVLLQKIERG